MTSLVRPPKSETAAQYRELFKLRATGKLEDMECAKHLYTLLEKLYFAGMRILDIPCGVGHYYKVLKNLGNIDYVGVDLDSKCIEIAKDIWSEDAATKFYVKNISEISQADYGIFDVVFCYNLLMHLDRFEVAIRNLLALTNRYLIIRGMFGEETIRESIPAADDYRHVYPSGEINYNVYSRNEVRDFIAQLGKYNVTFFDDTVKVAPSQIKRQSEILGVDVAYYSSEEKYEVLFVEKESN